MTHPAVLLLGAGRMGGALLEGWLAGGALRASPLVLEPQPSPSLQTLAAEGKIKLNPVPPSGGQAPEIAVVAVKPQIVGDALNGLVPWLGPETTILSIVAGKPIFFFQKVLGAGRRIVRAMPNTPAAIGQGMTVACGSPGISLTLQERCLALLRAVGDVAWVEDEALMDAVTALSGSGPAYVFLLVECLAEAGVAAGLEPALALRLARRTVSGAGALLGARPEAPSALRVEVTSPGGTTEAALKVLMGTPGLKELLRSAVEKAAARSRELAG